MDNAPIGPFGETLTIPSPSSGALATKNMCWRATQRRRWSSMRSNSFTCRSLRLQATTRPEQPGAPDREQQREAGGDQQRDRDGHVAGSEEPVAHRIDQEEDRVRV